MCICFAYTRKRTHAYIDLDMQLYDHRIVESKMGQQPMYSRMIYVEPLKNISYQTDFRFTV